MPEVEFDSENLKKRINLNCHRVAVFSLARSFLSYEIIVVSFDFPILVIRDMVFLVIEAAPHESLI